MDGFPSGQRGQTVNLLATPSKVRILLHPLLYKKSGILLTSYFLLYKKSRGIPRLFLLPLFKSGLYDEEQLHCMEACVREELLPLL